MSDRCTIFLASPRLQVRLGEVSVIGLGLRIALQFVKHCRATIACLGKITRGSKATLPHGVVVFLACIARALAAA